MLKRVKNLKEDYNLAHEDLLSEICFNFLRKSVIRKIDNRKGSPATFILHYVLNELRNIERSSARGSFDKAHRNCDAMDKVAFHFEDLDNDGTWIPELTDYEDPEALLIAQETLVTLRDLLGRHELSVLLGHTSMEQYSAITGLSRRGLYRRLSQARPVVEALLGSTVF
jgi:DNA-directed RNA polymerase specialized sigma24 family protein